MTNDTLKTVNASQSPKPLYPTSDVLLTLNLSEFPGLQTFLLQDKNQTWRQQHWDWGLTFLRFIARNKSEHTFVRFRNEIERFLLWVFLVKQEPLDGFRKNEILDYADHCWQPPVTWICLANHEKFDFIDGAYKSNADWLPFRLSNAKNIASPNQDKRKYRPSQQTLTAMFTALSSFYNHLIGEEICFGNPAQMAKKDCKYFIKDSQVKEVRRLSEKQWEYTYRVALELANTDQKYERTLFLIAALKTLFLRISELSERKNWSPTMNHFWEDSEGNWWLKIFGKGRKIRDITVPQSFIEHLKRYRLYRGLSALPHPSDTAPIVEKLRGQGGMTSRQLSRIVQDLFDKAYDTMQAHEGEDSARKLKEASTHWLRHTGASMEIERGRALKDLSEDLGHASMATTDTIYVQTENTKRAASGKSRKVN